MAFVYLLADANWHYVTAAGGGGGPLVAVADYILEWESFLLEDQNPETAYLCSGDYIHLKAYTGMYVCAENGGGTDLVANRPQAYGWETFRVVSQTQGLGARLDINNGIDQNGKSAGAIVALQAANGMYVCAENGGNSPLTANRTAIGP
jgi:hypothetical protein